MIEKLDVTKDTRNVIDKNGMVHTVANFTAVDKINELVDAVNSLRDDCNLLMGYIAPENKCEPAENGKCAKNAQDPYAEQRKWIGKLCWVWDDDSDERCFTKLTEIIEDDDDRPFKGFSRWQNCEPVKPDDDIIYKGE